MSGAASALTVGSTTTRGSGIRFLFITKYIKFYFSLKDFI